MSRRPLRQAQSTSWKLAPELSEALKLCRSHFAFAALFSIFVNILVFAYPIFMLQVFDRVMSSRSVETLVVLGMGFALALLFKAVFHWLQNALLARSSARMDRLLADRICTALLERSLRSPDPAASSALRDLDAVRLYLCGQGALAKMELPWAGLYIAALFSVDMVLGWVALCGMAVVGGLVAANAIVTKDLLNRANRASSAAQRFVDANVRSADAALPMGMMPGMIRRWRLLRDRAISAQLRATNRGGVFSSVLSVAQLAAQGALLGTGVLRIIEAGIPFGFAFMATIIFGFAMKPVMALVGDWEARQRTEQSLLRLNELLKDVPLRSNVTRLPRPMGEVSFISANYSVSGNARPILRNINLRIEAGSAHGILGPSGSGKSTLLRLMVGNFVPSYGSVRLDGTDIHHWARNELGLYIGYLPQEVCLVSGTVTDNIGRFGLFDEAAVVAAAKLSGAHDVIVRLPKGYDTPVGEGGISISGGQRQLIGLARAVVGHPALVVLDEPNSNLDGPGEARLLECVRSLRDGGTTVVMVSHRPNLFKDFDFLTHIRDGAVAATGTASEIMERMRPASAISVVPRGRGTAQPQEAG